MKSVMVKSSVDVTTIEMIKPSSPTPSHLRKFNLSFLDQLAPPIHIHLILYYEASNDPLESSLDTDKTSVKLKRSLSDALVTYYSLAGRIHENSWVDCNDAGVEYVEARFDDTRLVDVVGGSRVEGLEIYVPKMPHGGVDVPLAVQLNFFDCGGMAIGVCMSHQLADAASLVMFVNAWASACCDGPKTISLPQTVFELDSRFSPADFSQFKSPPPPPPSIGMDVPQKILTKRYAFDKKALTALREASSGPGLANPTRVEVVSAFLWKHHIEIVANGDKRKAKNTTFSAIHAVDIRTRATPRLPHPFFGNACARSRASINPTGRQNPDGEYTYHELAIKLRHTIRKVDSEYVKKLENGDTFMQYYSMSEENDPSFKDGETTLDTCGFSSWTQLPAYMADYGWGKPLWVSIISIPQKNLISLLGTKSGDGIEAWVNMAEEDIAEIDANYQMLCRNTLDMVNPSENCAPVNSLPRGRHCQEV